MTPTEARPVPPDTLAPRPMLTRPRFRVSRVRIVAPLPATVRGPRTRRSRANIAAGVVAFLAMQSGLNLAIRGEWLPLRDPVYAEKFEVLQAHPVFFEPRPPGAIPRVLAMGSSRTQLGFDATAVAAAVERSNGVAVEAFNFGCPAAGPMTNALYLRRLLESGASPDFVTVEIHPGFTTPLNPPYEARWLHLYRLRPSEVGHLRGLGWDVASPPHHGWQGWVAASFAYRYSILNRYAPKMMPCPFALNVGSKMDGRGHVPGPDLPAHQKPRALQRTHDEYGPTFVDYTAGGAGVAALRDMLAVCRERGIRTAVVLMPESSEYRSWYGVEGYRRVGALAAGLGQEFGAEVADAREWVGDAGFADGHHLTAAGCATFSERLAKDLIGPWVTRAGR